MSITSNGALQLSGTRDNYKVFYRRCNGCQNVKILTVLNWYAFTDTDMPQGFMPLTILGGWVLPNNNTGLKAHAHTIRSIFANIAGTDTYTCLKSLANIDTTTNMACRYQYQRWLKKFGHCVSGLSKWCIEIVNCHYIKGYHTTKWGRILSAINCEH